MVRIFSFITKTFLVLYLVSFCNFKVYAEDIEIVLQQLQEDIKTLEKAVYSQNANSAFSTNELSNEGNDVLTKHLLKLSELEEQFKTLTNNFEEINFKLDKISNRITKVQADNQIRFQDLENSNTSNTKSTKKKRKRKNYPVVMNLKI